MKKERLSVIANDIASYFYDLDPYNGMSEEEIMCETIDDLLERDGHGTKDSLEDIVNDTDETYNETDRKLALTLLNRLDFFLARLDTKGYHESLGFSVDLVAHLENFDIEKRTAKELLEKAEAIRTAVLD